MLRVAVAGADEAEVRPVVERLRGHSAARGRTPVEIVYERSPDPGAHHLVVGVRKGGEACERSRMDVLLPDPDDGPGPADDLWRNRIVPFAANLAAGHGAQRSRRIHLIDHGPVWRHAADRLAARLAAALGRRAHRIDHVGSTAVPGLPSQDVIDLHVVVDDIGAARACAEASHSAGFAAVREELYGTDRSGGRHEQCRAVGADPGRPADVHFHPAASPLWREALLLRDRLQADPERAAEYAAQKRRACAATGSDSDAYAREKALWAASVVERAAAHRS